MTLQLISIFLVTVALSLIFDGTKYSKQILICWGLFILLYACIVDKSDLPDYSTYVNYFTTGYSFIEPSFIFIRWIISSFLSNNVIYLFIIYLILGVGLKLIAFKRLTTLPVLTLAIYISSYFIYHEMIQIRAGIASALLLFTIKPLQDRNLKHFIFIASVATLFHTSSIVIFILWFINPFRKQRWGYLSLLFISILINCFDVDLIRIISRLPIPYIQEKLIGYSDISVESMNRGLLTAEEYEPFCTWYIFKLLLAIYFWLFVDKLSRYNKYSLLLIKIYTLGVSCLWLFSTAPTIATRCSELLTVVQVILIPLMIYSFKSIKIISYIPVIIIGFIWLLWNSSSFII